MSEIRQASIVIASAARLMARIAGMQAENASRWHLGEQVAYREGAFAAAIDDEGLGYKAVIMMLRGDG